MAAAVLPFMHFSVAAHLLRISEKGCPTIAQAGRVRFGPTSVLVNLVYTYAAVLQLYRYVHVECT
eukprot:SAG22_NODE_18442_length_287_cov_0.824468_1_plen_64_part_10